MYEVSFTQSLVAVDISCNDEKTNPHSVKFKTVIICCLLFVVVVLVAAAAAAPVVVLIKSRKIRWARQGSCMSKKRNLCRILMGKPKENILEDPDTYMKRQ